MLIPGILLQTRNADFLLRNRHKVVTVLELVHIISVKEFEPACIDSADERIFRFK